MEDFKGGTTMTNEDFNFNRYYLTLATYQINPRYLDEPQVSLGCGIDLRNPLSPIVAPYRAFELQEKSELQLLGLPVSSDVIEESSVFKESLSEAEESSLLSTYFKASYLLSSVQAAHETTKKEQQSYHTIYALLLHSGESESLPSKLRHWSSDVVPKSETISDKDEALLYFVSSYGSHYVSAIRYGLRIAIQGKLKKDSKYKATDFSTSFRAAFGSFSADAGVRSQQKKKLESMDIELMLEVTSGGRTDGGLLTMSGFDEISKFLNGVKNNEIKFFVAPIELTLKPYWVTLDTKWEKTRALLNPNTATFKVPSAPYGVPKGSIISWHPTADYIKDLEVDSSKKTIVPPPGWAICDGTLGTPNLIDHFIMGAATFERLGDVGGNTNHVHDVRLEKVARTSGMVTAAKQAVVHVEGKGTHIPPNVKLVFIMKLDDLP